MRFLAYLQALSASAEDSLRVRIFGVPITWKTCNLFVSANGFLTGSVPGTYNADPTWFQFHSPPLDKADDDGGGRDDELITPVDTIGSVSSIDVANASLYVASPRSAAAAAARVFDATSSRVAATTSPSNRARSMYKEQ